MDIDGFLNAASTGWRESRKRYHLTLGGLIEGLIGNEGLRVAVHGRSDGAFLLWGGLGKPDSYRGFYEDLAFPVWQEGTQTTDELLTICKNAIGETYYGYKGGEYLMDEEAPLWIAEDGDVTGWALVDWRVFNNTFHLIFKQV